MFQQLLAEPSPNTKRKTQRGSLNTIVRKGSSQSALKGEKLYNFISSSGKKGMTVNNAKRG